MLLAKLTKEQIMGQGTDSCGGYDLEYDPYEEGLQTGTWATKGGGSIDVNSMTLGHLKGAKRLCADLKRCATSSNEEEKWSDWINIFDDLIVSKPSVIKLQTVKNTNQKERGSKVECICKECNGKFIARVADRKRGWAKFCSKSCKAIKQMNR